MLLRSAMRKLRYTFMCRKSLSVEVYLIERAMDATTLCWGQALEDAVIAKLCPDRGVYIDIGANHPIHFSKTFKLYLKGWSGINIDPLPESKRWFDKYRKKDINLNIGISARQGVATYHRFQDPSYNTLSDERAVVVKERGLSDPLPDMKIDVKRLDDVFDKYYNHFNRLDFMTIDVESKELDVLKSNNWDKYRPKYIALEALNTVELKNVLKADTIKFLEDKGYSIIFKIFQTVFLKDMRMENSREGF